MEDESHIDEILEEFSNELFRKDGEWKSEFPRINTTAPHGARTREEGSGKLIQAANNIDYMFTWEKTREGYEFWYYVKRRLMEMSSEVSENPLHPYPYNNSTENSKFFHILKFLKAWSKF